MITLAKAHIEDIELINEMQVKSFRVLLDKYKDYSTNPAMESVARTKEKFEQSASVYYLIRLGDTVIGALRIMLQGDYAKLAPIFLLPEFQGRGYSQQALTKLDELYSDVNRWVLDTIKQEAKLCYIYEKMGYLPTGKEEELKEDMTIIFYEKSS